MLTKEGSDRIILESLMVINRRLVREAIEKWDRDKVSGKRFDRWVEGYSKKRWEEIVVRN